MGFLNADLWMPIAELKKTGTSSAGYVGANTMGRALILSSADIEKNVYYVPAGKRAEFTLVALTYSNPERGISISGLPHYIQRNGESKQLRQMPSEDLKEFTSIAP